MGTGPAHHILTPGVRGLEYETTPGDGAWIRDLIAARIALQGKAVVEARPGSVEYLAAVERLCELQLLHCELTDQALDRLHGEAA